MKYNVSKKEMEDIRKITRKANRKGIKKVQRLSEHDNIKKSSFEDIEREITTRPTYRHWELQKRKGKRNDR